MKIDEDDLLYIEKFKKTNSPRYLLYSMGLPIYFIFNTLINWDILGEKGSWSIISLSLLMAAILFSYWKIQQKIIIILDKLKENQVIEKFQNKK